MALNDKKEKSGSIWTPDEDEFLKTEAKAGTPLKTIAEKLKRTPFAVLLRAREKSGLESPEDRYELVGFDDREKSIRESFSDFSLKWSAADITLLKRKFESEHKGLNKVAKEMKRTPNGVSGQLKKMYSLPDLERMFDTCRFCYKAKRIVNK